MKIFRTAAKLLTLLSVVFAFSVSAYAALKMAPDHAQGATAPIAVLQTVKGTIVIRLYPKDAPQTVANFIKLVNKGFYNGLTFHRVDNLGDSTNPSNPGKIIQGGDPNGNGTGGPGYTIKGEFPANGVNNPLLHTAGAVAMARETGYDTAGSQFYICINPVPDLNGNYAVFGYVIKGLDVANKIVVGDKITKAYMSQDK